MRLGIILSMIVALFCFSAVGQPPPPPAALIYSPPDLSDIKEFKDEISKFKVSFPGIPEKKVATLEKLLFVHYKVYRKGSNSTLTVTSLPEDAESRASTLYNSYRDRLRDMAEREFEVGPPVDPSQDWRITLDREIKTGSILGREFGYDTNRHFIHVAVFARGNQFFEVKTTVANWDILKQSYPEIVAAFNAESSRFIRSFEFLR